MTRGMGALSRIVGTAWRRSLQLRVVALTLGLSLAVILALGFVLTSQLTNRVLDVKVRAAIEQIERARTTVGGIVSGEETRSLDSSLQLARNTLTSKTDPASGAGLAGAFDAVLMVPGDGPRAATSAGPVDQVPNSLRGFIRAGQAAYQYATVHTDGFSGPALIIGTPASAQVANLELYLIFPLKNEQATIQLVRGTMITGGVVLLVLLAGIALLVSRQVVVPVRSASRIAERFAEGHLSERMPVRGDDDMARLAVSFNDMAESLSRQITQLEEFGNLQRRFTSDVSHELRSPLTTLSASVGVLNGHRDELDPRARRALSLLDGDVKRFTRMVDDLLEISRFDAGSAELSLAEVDPVELVRRAVFVSAAAGARAADTDAATGGIPVVEGPGVAGLRLSVDKRRFERIMANLIENAALYAGGVTRVVVAREPPSERSPARAVRVLVDDEGPGIAGPDRARLFERFYRGSRSGRRESGDGTGLGLSLVAEHVRLHRGSVWIESTERGGARFVVELPLATEPPPGPGHEQESPA